MIRQIFSRRICLYPQNKLIKFSIFADSCNSNLRPLSTSSILLKIRRGKQEKLEPRNALDINKLTDFKTRKEILAEDDENEDENGNATASTTAISAEALAVKASKEMEQYYNSLIDNISKHMTITVNLKTYDELPVTMDTGETHKLGRLARITMQSPNKIALNFADHIEAIRSARIALMALGDNLNLQQEGFMIYVPVPKITRERREELAKNVSAAIFNEFKKGLNQIYTRSTREISKSTKVKDLEKKLANGLLKEMHKFLNMGEQRVKERKEALLSEVL